MLLGTQNKTNQSKGKFKLSIDDTEVKEVSTFKFLGITVDQNLSWKNHVDDLTKKCSSSIGILYKVKQFLPGSALLSLHYTLFLSHINYGRGGQPTASGLHAAHEQFLCGPPGNRGKKNNMDKYDMY